MVFQGALPRARRPGQPALAEVRRRALQRSRRDS